MTSLYKTMTTPIIIDFDQIPAVPCPCGQAKRAFVEQPQFPGTIHLTEISTDARTHYHKTLTETYFIIECAADAAIELDGQIHSLKPGLCIQIPPGVRHRALGEMKILNIVFPKFDPADEHFDELPVSAT